MASDIEYIASLDPEDLTAKQWRKIFRYNAMRGSRRKQDDDQDSDADQAAEDNEKLVDLQEEKKGKSKAPEVAADDLPEGVEVEEPKKKKKSKA